MRKSASLVVIAACLFTYLRECESHLPQREGDGLLRHVLCPDLRFASPHVVEHARHRVEDEVVAVLGREGRGVWGGSIAKERLSRGDDGLLDLKHLQGMR